MSFQNIVLMAAGVVGYKLVSYVVANRARFAALLKQYLDKLAAQNTPARANPLLGGGAYAEQPQVTSSGLLASLLKSPLLTVALAVGATLVATKLDFKQMATKIAALASSGGSAVVVVPEPTAADKTIVAPLLQLVKGKPGASDLAPMYLAAADILERDTDNKLSTSGQLTNWLADATTLAYVNTEYANKFPGFEVVMTTIIIDTLKDASTTGDEDIAMTPEKKAKFITVLKACAWACQQ